MEVTMMMTTTTTSITRSGTSKLQTHVIIRLSAAAALFACQVAGWLAGCWVFGSDGCWVFGSDAEATNHTRNFCHDLSHMCKQQASQTVFFFFCFFFFLCFWGFFFLFFWPYTLLLLCKMKSCSGNNPTIPESQDSREQNQAET
jgi:hypothetical protein